MSNNVVNRTSEIGLRMALGARKRDVLELVMGQTGRLVFMGFVIGLPGCLAATRLLGSLFYGFAPADSITILFAMSIMAAVTAGAGYLPARRASRVAPIVALKHD
jgi:putative ABC transport system permease protein